MRSSEEKNAPVCRICKGVLSVEMIDAGLQPLSNRYLTPDSCDEYMHPMLVRFCTSCGLLQIPTPPPVSEIVPRFKWITYNEPEEHLDLVADQLIEFGTTKKRLVAAGVSYKDDTLLTRLKTKGVDTVWRVSARELGVNGTTVEIETVQERLTAGKTADLFADHERPDILLVRHVLEHAHDTGSFLASVKEIVKPCGMILFEVPDCTTVMTTKDYSTIWEEHVLYFTEHTLRHCLENNGFVVKKIENYQYPLENSLVAFAVSANDDAAITVTESEIDVERGLAHGYLSAFQAEKGLYRRILEKYRSKGKIAVLGAGHLTCAFINLFGLREFIECVIDDDRHRQGLLMPGSRIPIMPSQVLRSGQIALCLLGVNPLNEEKVLDRHREFRDSGGEFRSLFPVSRIALRNQ